jgi:glycosyltransferase involved in cell wall biosynthesis
MRSWFRIRSNRIIINEKEGYQMKAAHLGMGIIPVPPGDKAAGIEKYIYHLTNHLGRLGCQVHVIDIKGGAYQREKRQESSARFHEAWHLPLPYRYNFPFWEPFFNYIRVETPIVFFALSSSPVLHRLMGREKIEVIHTHNRDTTLASIMVNRLRRNRAVTVYAPKNAYKLEKLSRRQRVIRFAEILALRWVDHVVAETPALKGWLVSEFNLDPAKITPIHLGAAVDEIEQFISKKAGACHQSNMVLCTGVIQPRKNQFTAVKAILQVIKTHPEVKLVFAGPIAEAGYLHSIQRFIAENNLSAHVEFKGEVTRQELYNLYSDATLFLFPTTADLQTSALTEALAFGLPVISSTIKPIADVVGQKEGCAILVDPYDVDGMAAAIIRVLDDSELRQSMSERAKELARTFSYENIAAQTLALYEKLVQNKKQSPR